MPDEMFFTNDAKSLRRGRRRQPRTTTCRPCMLWPKDAPDMAFQGVVIDMNPYGMGVRMLEALPPGTQVMVQLMADEQFSYPMAEPLEGMIVRATYTDDGFAEHGIQLKVKDIIPAERSRPVQIKRKQPVARVVQKTRMHIRDYITRDRNRR